jgi:hypothetical protein
MTVSLVTRQDILDLVEAQPAVVRDKDVGAMTRDVAIGFRMCPRYHQFKALFPSHAA